MAVAKLVPIDLLDGKPRNLKLSNLGIIRFEDYMGKPVDQVMNEPVNMKMIVGLLWASLLWEEKALTLEGASDLLEGWVDAGDGQPLDLVPKLLEALAESSYYRNRRRLNGEDREPDLKKSPDSNSSPTPTTT